MVNPVGKAAVFAAGAAVAGHVAWVEYKREQERKAAEAESKREQASHRNFREEMARAAKRAAAEGRAQRNARDQRSEQDRRAIAELTELRVSLMGRALGQLRVVLTEDFSREAPLSAVGLPLIGRADSVDFVIAAVLLAWGDDELLEAFWPRRRRKDGEREEESDEDEDKDEGEGVEIVESYRVGFCVQRCSPEALALVRAWLQGMAKSGPVAPGEWTLESFGPGSDEELPAARKAKSIYGRDALFGLHSGPPRFDHSSSDLAVELLAMRTFLRPADCVVKELNIRSHKHFKAVSPLGHVDLVSASHASFSVTRQKDGRFTGKTVMGDGVGVWKGPGTYNAANFPLRTSAPLGSKAPSLGAGFFIPDVDVEFPEPRRGGDHGDCRYSLQDLKPLTKWLPGEKLWRKASSKEAFVQGMLSREAAGLLQALTPSNCEGAGLWHFLALSGEVQPYASAMLALLEHRDVGLLESGGDGKGEDIGRVLAASLRNVVPPPSVGEGGTRQEAMEALDDEIDTFLHGCYLELLRSLYSVPAENHRGKTPADLVPDSSMHADLWGKVWAWVPSTAKKLRILLRSAEDEKREQAAAAARGRRCGRGTTPLWWKILLSAIALSCVVVLQLAAVASFNPTQLMVFRLVGEWVPEWALEWICTLLVLVNRVLWAPAIVFTLLEFAFRPYRPPPTGISEDEYGRGGEGDRSWSLGAALLWRVDAAAEISSRLFNTVALLMGMTPPVRRSREELMAKCKACLLVWGVRQLHNDMVSATRRGRITTASVLQLADGISSYRAEQKEAATAAAAANEPSGKGGFRGCEERGTFPGSLEEAGAFLDLPVVPDAGADGAEARGEGWFNTPLPGSAVEGALNMAVFGTFATGEEGDQLGATNCRLSLEAGGRSSCFGGCRSGDGGRFGVDRKDPDGDDDDDDDDDDDSTDDERPASRQVQRERRRQRRSMPLEELSYQQPVALAPRPAAAHAGTSGARINPAATAGAAAGETKKGVSDTVRGVLESRGWRFDRAGDSVAYTLRPKYGQKKEAAHAKARGRFVASRSFWHDSVGVGSEWSASVRSMMMTSPEDVVAMIAAGAMAATNRIKKSTS